MRSRTALALVVLALLLPTAASVAAAVSGAPTGTSLATHGLAADDPDALATNATAADSAPSGSAVQQTVTPTPNATPTPSPADRVDENLTPPGPSQVIVVDVRANGDARWHVQTRLKVDNESDVAAFESLAASARDGGLGYSRATFERFLGIATAATGRENMAIENATWSTRVVNESASVRAITFSVTWTNFAVVDGVEVVVDDVFDRPERPGTWLSELDADQRLVIEGPAGYLTAYAPTASRNGTVQWDGPYRFGDDELRVVYAPAGGSTETTTTPEEDGALQWLAGGGLLVVVAAGVAYLLARRRPFDEDRPPASEAATETDGEAATETDGVSGPETTASGAGTAADATGSTAAANGARETAGSIDAGDDAAAEDEDGIDVELLSDEERVERLLRQNGGRMKQANIVSETGWSNAKVSQLLSAMDEDGRVEKLRIGRENLITLPDENVGDLE